MTAHPAPAPTPPQLEFLAELTVIDPSAIYFRCSLRLSTASEKWWWLNHLVAVGAGERRPDSVRIAVFTVL